jgi:selenocysteine-specific elongation factor
VKCVGDTLWLTGVNKPMRVRGLHAKSAAERAHAGQRIALNIAGDAKRRTYRGDWLLADAPPEALNA